jgi:hypothetical protein
MREKFWLAIVVTFSLNLFFFNAEARTSAKGGESLSYLPNAVALFRANWETKA